MDVPEVWSVLTPPKLPGGGGKVYVCFSLRGTRTAVVLLPGSSAFRRAHATVVPTCAYVECEDDTVKILAKMERILFVQLCVHHCLCLVCARLPPLFLPPLSVFLLLSQPFPPLTLSHFTSPHLTSPHLTSPGAALSCARVAADVDASRRRRAPRPSRQQHRCAGGAAGW